MRLVNLLIMGLYSLNLVIDLFSDTGSTFLRILLVVVAYIDFGTFVVTITRRLSNYLQFPIFGLPAELKGVSNSPTAVKSGDFGQNRAGGNPKLGGDYPDRKLESSLENGYGDAKEPKEPQDQFPMDYVKELEFDEDTEEGFETDANAFQAGQEYSNVEGSNQRLKP